MRSARAVLGSLLGLLCLATVASGQTPIDSSLLSYINGIRAIDSHAHPMRPVASGTPPDTEYDALPLDAIPPFSFPARPRQPIRFGGRPRPRFTRFQRPPTT